MYPTDLSQLIPEEQLRIRAEAGFDTRLGYLLAMRPDDRLAFSQMLSMVVAAKSVGVIDDSTPQTFADREGVLRTLPTIDFIHMMLAYGSCYKSMWEDTKSSIQT